MCEIMRNSEKIRTYSRSGSSKVIDLGVNRKRICDFILVTNSNFGLGHISYRFLDAKSSVFNTAPLFGDEEHVRISG